MDIVLAMLATEAAEKTYIKKWNDIPYSVERKIDGDDSNIALYHYLVSNAIQYPKRWFDGRQSAKALAMVDIIDGDINIKDIKIMQKSNDLDTNEIIDEAIKTLHRASASFPKPSELPLSLNFLLEWKLKP